MFNHSISTTLATIYVNENQVKSKQIKQMVMTPLKRYFHVTSSLLLKVLFSLFAYTLDVRIRKFPPTSTTTVRACASFSSVSTPLTPLENSYSVNKISVCAEIFHFQKC
jgi:hypothetical protein